MAVNLPPIPNLLPVAGFEWGTAAAGIRYVGRDDIAVLVCSPDSVAGGVYTQNRFKAAPVIVAQENEGNVRALLVNSGNANAATGKRGLRDAKRSCQQVATQLGCQADEVLPFSTGVIGEFLPMDKLQLGIEKGLQNRSQDSWVAAARAIMTTDTQPKGYSHTFDIRGQKVTTTGIAKGSGMIRPDMATMLAFQATDARFSGAVAKQLAQDLTEVSFNRITVDGDTSTNDAFVVLGSGMVDHERIEDPTSSDYRLLRDGMAEVTTKLAEYLVRDAEGATKFVTIQVNQGRSERECLQVAYTIAHSPLVKTALFAGDPNWGRFCMAIGRAGISDLNPDLVSLYLDDVQIAREGLVAETYSEALAAQVMAQDEFLVKVNLARGEASASVLTSDFSYDYVKINAEYRT